MRKICGSHAVATSGDLPGGNTVKETCKKFDLNDYIPCQLASVSQSITRSLAALLEERYGVSLPEWKVLAIIRETPSLSAVAVARRAQMDTVAVSRAVTKLLDRGLVCRDLDSEDRRRSVLDVSAAGLELHDEIAPLAAELESSLLEELTDEEKLAFVKAIQVLQSKAAVFTDAYSAPPRRQARQIRGYHSQGNPDRLRPQYPGPLVTHRVNGSRTIV